MRTTRPGARLVTATRLGTLAIVAAVLLILGQLMALASTEPTVSDPSKVSTEEVSAEETAPGPTGPSAAAEPSSDPSSDAEVEEADPEATSRSSADRTRLGERSDDGSRDGAGTGGRIAGGARPALGANTVVLDADSHCDRPTGHVIIEATITNTAAQSVSVIATDVTFSGTSSGPVTVAPGDSHMFVFDAGPSPLPGGTVRYDLTWQDGTTESVSANHSPTKACGPSVTPSLGLVKTGPSAVANGSTFTYTVTITNTGAGAASDVVVTDDLHDALTGVSATSTIGSCSVAAGNVVTCTVGTLGAAGSGSSSATITITATAPAGTCPTITNTATATHAGGQVPPSGTVSTSVTGCGGPVPQPGLSVAKTAHDDSVEAGQPVGFTIVVTSTGTAAATDVTLEDTLPAFPGASWTIAAGSASGCSIANGVLSCAFGDLDPGATRTVHVTSPTSDQACGTLDNLATADGSNVPPVSDGAGATVTCDQQTNPDIAVEKRARPTHGEPGDTITYVYVVRNTGDTTLFDVTLVDDRLGKICEIARLEPGEQRRCTATWRIPAGASGNVRNVVVAEGTDESGETVRDRDRAVINVVLGRTVTPTPPPNPPPTTTPPSGLAFTGPGAATIGFGAAALLLVIGTGLLWLGRRVEEADPVG